jgi:hypothetical protein
VKFFCLFCSLLLWFYVVTDRTFDQTVEIPITLNGLPGGWIPARPLPERAEVRFLGTGKALLALRNRGRIEIDLHEIPADTSVLLSLDMVKGLPAEAPLRPMAILQPLQVNVRLDRYRERKVPIRSAMTTTPLEGYTLVGEVRFEPDSVLVSGPASALGRIDAVWTTRREYRNLIRPLSGKIALSGPGPLIRVSRPAVNFETDVQRIGERVFNDVPVLVRHAPPGLFVTADPPVLSLKLQGGVDLLSNLKKEDVVAVVDYVSSRRFDSGYPATLKLPQDVGFSDVSPRFFRLITRQ